MSFKRGSSVVQFIFLLAQNVNILAVLRGWDIAMRFCIFVLLSLLIESSQAQQCVDLFSYKSWSIVLSEAEINTLLAKEPIISQRPILNSGASLGVLKSGHRVIVKKSTYVSVDFEYTAYLLDRALGLGIVPETQVRIVGGEIVVVQKFIEDAREGGIDFRVHSYFHESLFVLDYILNNRDRHGRNWLIDSSGNIHAIDNSFVEFSSLVPQSPSNITTLKPYVIHLSPSMVEKLKKLSQPGNFEEFKSRLLFSAPVEYYKSRVQELLRFNTSQEMH